MGNLISNLLAKASPMGQMLQQTAGMANAMKPSNPMGMLMGQNNPQLKQVMEYIQSCGGNAQQAFFMLAKQKGVDPNSVIEQTKSMLGQR